MVRQESSIGESERPCKLTLDEILSRAAKKMLEETQMPLELQRSTDKAALDGWASLERAWSSRAKPEEIAAEVPPELRPGAHDSLARKIYGLLSGAFLELFILNKTEYELPDRNEDAKLYFLRKLKGFGHVLFIEDLDALEPSAEEFGKHLGEHELWDIEAHLRALSVPIAAESIALNDDATINALLRALDPESRVEIRFKKNFNRGMGPIHYIFGLVQERDDKLGYTLFAELISSAAQIGLVSSSQFMKGAYEGEILIRAFCLGRIIENSYARPCPTEDFSGCIVNAMRCLAVRTGEGAAIGFDAFISRVLIRSIRSYRSRKLVKFEIGPRNGELESALGLLGKGPHMILEDLSSAVSELLGNLESVMNCEIEGACVEEIFISLLCNIRDSYYVSMSETSYYFLAKTLIMGTLLFDIDFLRPMGAIVERMRESSEKLARFGDSWYARINERILLFINERLYDLGDSSPAELPLYRDLKNRAIGDVDPNEEAGGFPVTSTHNAMRDLLLQMRNHDPAAAVDLKALAIGAYKDVIEDLASKFWPAPVAIDTSEDIDRALDELLGKARKIARAVC